MDGLVQRIISTGKSIGLALVEQVIRQSLPDGQIMNIVPINGEGVSHSTKLYRFHYSNGHLIELVIKIGQGIGDQEQQSRILLCPYLPLAETMGSRQSDVFVYHFIPGVSVDCLVRQKSQIAERCFEHFVNLSMAMWRRTAHLVPRWELTGYPVKMASTSRLVESCQIQGQPLTNFVDLPIMVNSKVLPPLGECLCTMSELISGDAKMDNVPSVLQHGDEGAVNFIVRDDDERAFFIDNGNAGQRLLAEGLAKLCLWWAVTAPQSRGEATIRDGQIRFNYSVSVPEHISRTVRPTIERVLSDSHLDLDQRQLAACFAVYCIREMQWTNKRRFPFSPITLLAMAFDAMDGMFGGKINLPGFDGLRV